MLPMRTASPYNRNMNSAPPVKGIKRAFIWWGAAALAFRASFCSLTLLPGESWSFEFQQLPFSHVEQIGETPEPFFPTLSAGFVQVVASSGSAFAGRLGLLDMFENSVSEPLLFGTTLDVNGPGAKEFVFGAAGYWADLQGVIQIRAQEAIEVQSLNIRVHFPRDDSSYAVYAKSVVVPEPSVLNLSALMAGVLFGVRFLQRSGRWGRGTDC